MQAPVFPGFYRAKPFSRRKCTFSSGWHGADGAVEVSVDPLRSTLFQGVLFLAILLLGGLWAFRSMTKLEIAASAFAPFLFVPFGRRQKD